MPDEVVLESQEEEGYSPEEAKFMADEPESEEVDEKSSDSEPKVVETKVEEPPGETKEQEEPKRVPLSELIKERKDRQAAEHRFKLASEKLEYILQQADATPEIKSQVPDRDNDPAGYLAYQNELILKRLDATEQESQQVKKQTEEQRLEQEFDNKFREEINVFASQKPDYNEAALFLATHRDKELEQLARIYPEYSDPAVRMQVLRMEAKQLGLLAMQQGINPGDVFYEMAHGKGYTGKPVVPPSPPAPNKEKMDTIKKGIEAATTLSNTGGSPPGEITVEALLDMDMDAFAKATQGKKWNKMHGRK